jgi:hypothetical protein
MLRARNGLSSEPVSRETQPNLGAKFHTFRTIPFSAPVRHRERMASVRSRSAGVTAAATYAILCCTTAFVVWGYVFLVLLNAAPFDDGRYFYQLFPARFLLVALVPPAAIAFGIRTAVGLLHLRPWARWTSMVLAATFLVLSLVIIAFRPFETFVIPHQFVSQGVLTQQMFWFSSVILLLPASIWWLFYFRTRKVKLQFCPPEA